MTKPKLILDVDTGSDDAVALALAMLGGEAELLGITTVNGNLELKLTTDNTLRVVDLCGMGDRVPVYPGCEYPLVSTLNPRSAQSMRPIPKREGTSAGKFGMHSDHLPLPATDLAPQKQAASVWMIETVMAAQPQTITLVALGPLTNVAAAMRVQPQFAQRLQRIVLMGGADETGNETAAAEFNIWADPEAAEIVLQSGVPIAMIPLDATHQAFLSAEQAEQIDAIGTPLARFIAQLLRDRIAGYAKRDPEMAAKKIAPLHDALALCYALHPECIRRSVETVCHVDLGGGAAYGRTVLDRRANMVQEKPNCTFALEPDREFFCDWLIGILQKAAEKNG